MGREYGRLAMNNIKELLNYLKLNYILYGGLRLYAHCCIREFNPALFYERSVPSNYITEKLRCYYYQDRLAREAKGGYLGKECEP